MSPESFLNGRVVLHAGDSRDVIKGLPDNSIDSIVCDPPYALTSASRNGSARTNDPETPYGRTKLGDRGFMGKQWDTGETAFAADFWAECLRVLKPGGHVVAFSATRTYHRMAVAIEDAGFEIRDMLNWLYGSGFPKSHDVSKGIDKRGGANLSWFGPWLREWRERRGISQSELAIHFPSKSGGKTGRVSNFELGVRLPTTDDFNLICKVLDLPFASIQEAERDVIGQKNGDPKRFKSFAEQDGNERVSFGADITAPSTDAARQWEGWGTALKPACEPICFGRKPLISTVAGNVLTHGTGAINIDACRVASDGRPLRVLDATDSNVYSGRTGEGGPGKGLDGGSKAAGVTDVGRWPANILHDGSHEVLAAFPDASFSSGGGMKRDGKNNNVYGEHTGHKQVRNVGFGDGGSAARFFYTAKADANDRIGSKHPTVKPVDLMQWLCRLVTPKGGTVLDPFAGTGTTGEAAFREGFNAILIEREVEYQADIRRRMALAKSGPEERKRESIKAKIGEVPFQAGSLFADLETAGPSPEITPQEQI